MHISKRTIALSIVTFNVVAPASVLAASDQTIESLLYIFVIASALILLIWVVYFFSPVHRHFMRRNAEYKRVFLPLVGLVALAFGTVAAITGEAYLPGGNTILRELEDKLFWRYVTLQFGAGVVLILVGLLYPKGRS